MVGKVLAVLTALIAFALGLPQAGHAETVRSLVTVSGAPYNQLVGYGLVVGLPGTGDQATQVPYTTQAVTNMLRHMGVRLTGQTFMQPRDVAAVMVTATVQPYVHGGQRIDVSVAAVGNAASLHGGILLPTPLQGANGLTYAQAQGPVLVSGAGAQAAGTQARTNTPTVGQIPEGGILSQSIPTAENQGGQVKLLLDTPSFTTSARIADAIQARFGPGSAEAVSPGMVVLPNGARMGMAAMGAVMSLDVMPARQPPQVVIDAGSGTIVMGDGVELGPAVVSHGDLTVRIGMNNAVVQPGPFSNGQTAGVSNATVAVSQSQAHVVLLPHATTLAAVARALNAIGATPSDLIAIVQALRQAGALKARVKVL